MKNLDAIRPLKSKRQISKVFEDINHFYIIAHHTIINNKSHCGEWFIIQDYHDYDRKLIYFRIIESIEDIQNFLESAVLFSHYLEDPDRHFKELKMVPIIAKYAKFQKEDKIEVLSNFCGIPLKDLWPTLQKQNVDEPFLSKALDDSTKVSIMTIIYSCCMRKLLNLVCGTLSTSTILFDCMSLKVRIQDAYALKNIDQVTYSNPFYIEKPGIYYSQTYQKLIPRPLNKSQAMTADMKALAICIWELGLPDSIAIGDFIVDNEIVVSKLIKYDKIFYDNDQDQGKKLKIALLTILCTHEDLTYKIDKLKIDIPHIKLSRNFQTVMIEEENQFSLGEKPYIIPNIKLRRIQIPNRDTYCIYYNNNKQNGDIVQQYQCLQTYKRKRTSLPKIQISDQMLRINVFLKIKEDIKAKQNDLTTEYERQQLSNKFKYLPYIDITSFKAMLNYMLELCATLNKYRLFHGDIKPINISLENAWQRIIIKFDYDISNPTTDFNIEAKLDYGIFSIIPRPVKPTKFKFDEDLYTFRIKSFSQDFSSPEILKSLLGGKTAVQINPFKSNIYTLAKTMLAIITRRFNRFDFMETFYGIKLIDTTNYLTNIEELVKNLPLYNCTPHKAIAKTKSLAVFYCANNDKLVSQVKKFKADHIMHNPIRFQSIMNLLAAMLATDPSERPNLEQLRTMHHQITNIGKWENFIYAPQFQMLINEVDCQIIAFHSSQEYSLFTDFEYITTIFQNPSKFQHQIIKVSKYQTSNGDGTYKSSYTYSMTPLNHLLKYLLNSSMAQVQCITDNKSYSTCYLIGGACDLKPVNTVLALEKNLLVKKASMAYARAEFGAISWNNYITVAGGVSDIEHTIKGKQYVIYLNTLELYNAKYDKWSDPVMLREHKKNVAMAYNDKKVYVIGGILDAGSSMIQYGNMNKNFGKLIEVVNVESNTLEQSIYFNITSDLANGICVCPVLFEDNQTMLLLRDNLMVAGTDFEQCEYEMNLDTKRKEAVMALRLTSKFYNGCYKAMNCIDLINKYVIIPQFNEFVEPMEGKIIEYSKTQKQWQIFSWTNNNQNSN